MTRGIRFSALAVAALASTATRPSAPPPVPGTSPRNPQPKRKSAARARRLTGDDPHPELRRAEEALRRAATPGARAKAQRRVDAIRSAIAAGVEQRERRHAVDQLLRARTDGGRRKAARKLAAIERARSGS